MSIPRALTLYALRCLPHDVAEAARALRVLDLYLAAD